MEHTEEQGEHSPLGQRWSTVPPASWRVPPAGPFAATSSPGHERSPAVEGSSMPRSRSRRLAAICTVTAAMAGQPRPAGTKVEHSPTRLLDHWLGELHTIGKVDLHLYFFKGLHPHPCTQGLDGGRAGGSHLLAPLLPPPHPAPLYAPPTYQNNFFVLFFFINLF